MARVLHAQGDLGGARQRLERSLAIQTNLYGTDLHPSVAASLNNLADIHVAEDDHAGAVSLYRRVLQIEAVCYKTRDHYKSAETETSLASCLLQMGEAEEAIALLLHAMQVFSDQVPNHPLLADIKEFFQSQMEQAESDSAEDNS